MDKKEYIMGTNYIQVWRSGLTQQITFVITQECNLRCKYCYMTGKNNNNIMSFDVAKTTIDYFLANANELFATDFIVIDFIGGEALLEIDLIDQIVDYFKITTYKNNSKYFGKFRISIQTNGILYDNEKFQYFLQKNKGLVSVGMTIDGTKLKHDLQRVFLDGSGSYDIVEKNFLLSMRQGFGGQTKVTFSHDDLPLLKDSIIHLWNLGCKSIPANTVLENVWSEKDPEIYYDQLKQLADYILDKKLWDKYNVTFFNEQIGFRLTEKMLIHPMCGTGRMYCVDAKGDVYNCVRFMDYSLNNNPSIKYGNVFDGINTDLMRPLKTLYRKYINKGECYECSIASDCSYCAANNYDNSENESLFNKATFNCNMHKARVKANNYYWSRLYNEHAIKRQNNLKNDKSMFILLSDNCVNYCNFHSKSDEKFIQIDDLINGLKYAFDNFYQPVFVYSDNSNEFLNYSLQDKDKGMELKNEMNRHILKKIIKYNNSAIQRDTVYVFDKNINLPISNLNAPVILNIDADDLSITSELVERLLNFTSRINLNIRGMNKYIYLNEYEKQLKIMVDIIFSYLMKGHKKEIRQLTDRLFVSKMNNCNAGEKNITLAPDGNMYACPAFYFDKKNNVDVKKNIELMKLKNAPICSECDSYQCNRCIYLNYVGTGELNTPTKIQCVLAHLERQYSIKLLAKLKCLDDYEYVDIPELAYNDPLIYLDDRILNKGGIKI